MKIPSLLLALLALSSGAALAAEPVANSRKAIVIGIDGCRPDVLSAQTTPTLMRLAATGRFTAKGYTGGNLGTPTQQPTMSAPGWTSILTGVWKNKHGVTGNDFKNAALGPDAYPHFAYRFRAARPTIRIASIVGWAPINRHIADAAGNDAFAYRFASDGAGEIHEHGDAQVQEKLLARLASGNDDILFVQYDQVDGAGHKFGFDPNNAHYIRAAATVDTAIAEVLAALKKRPGAAAEDWLVLVTTDHGGLGKNHGGQSPEERTTFLIAAGPGIAAKRVETAVPITCVPATLADWMGIPAEKSWDPDAPSFLKP